MERQYCALVYHNTNKDLQWCRGFAKIHGLGVSLHISDESITILNSSGANGNAKHWSFGELGTAVEHYIKRLDDEKLRRLNHGLKVERDSGVFLCHHSQIDYLERAIEDGKLPEGTSIMNLNPEVEPDEEVLEGMASKLEGEALKFVSGGKRTIRPEDIFSN